MKQRRAQTKPAPQVPILRPGMNASASAQLVTIEKPIYGGSFLARVDGKAIFVPLTLPGEQARIRIVEDREKRGYAKAEVEQLLSTAPERIVPRCPHFGPCGGCNYQHTGYAHQLDMKRAILRETLERAGVTVPEEIAILSAQPWEYRNRIRVGFDVDGNPGYRARRSHDLVPIRECPIAAPLLVRAAMTAGEALARVPLNLRPHEALLFCDGEESALLATFFVKEPAQLRLDSIAMSLRERIPQLHGAELAVGGRPGHPARSLAQWGSPSLTYRTQAAGYRVDHGAFFQVNRWLLCPLVDRVIAGHNGALAWDLFAGVGLFARQLAARFGQVRAVESAGASTLALTANLAGTGGEGVAMPVLDFLCSRTHKERPDLIIVDPPRTGLGEEINRLLGEIAAPALVYVSCDPATLARDLRTLLASGYALESIALADLFPQTFHLETIVRLRHS
jgi:23S rRNA (uracil1939-C5)-methyltransferase